MAFLQDFKAFAVKGNAIDMAVGVIIGGAFGKIVTSIVNDLIMPPIGWLIGGVDFKDLKVELPINPMSVEEGVSFVSCENARMNLEQEQEVALCFCEKDFKSRSHEEGASWGPC